MRDTTRRINEYQKKLPLLRAKVMSVAIFLMISVIMMTSATFAWLTVSKSPEIKGISTTIVGNGNLEIALSGTDGKKPAETVVGDGKLAIVNKNLTWGNLVNLSDPSYGLDKIVLRPASLNTSALLTNPLFAAKYSEDGRIEDLISDFAYTNYDVAKKMFLVPGTTQYGVRAISSVTYTFAGGNEIFIERLQEASSRLNMAKTQYSGLTGNQQHMGMISEIMGHYLTDRFNGSKTDYQNYIAQMYAMIQEFNTCMETTGEAVVRIANLQLMLKKGNSATPYTLSTLMSASDTELTNNGISIEGFSVFKTDYTALAGHMKTMETLNQKATVNGQSVYWDELKNVVNFLVHIDSVEVDGMAVNTIGRDEAAGLVLGGKEHKAVIKKGALFNMEQRLGAYMFAEDLPVTVTYKITMTLKADVYTSASPAAYLQAELEKVRNSNSGSFIGTDPVAADTYGMAIDFWVRSNAANDYLTLEGTVKTVEVQKTDAQGNKYFTNEDGAVIIQSKDGKYYDENGKEVSGEGLTITYEKVVIGYEGENRVWDDEILKEYSATQGGGSCYVFYADTPQDQAQTLKVLSAMTVAFIDEDGKLLAYADMDTELSYKESGRVTVPMKLRSNSLKIGQDEAGNDIYAITELKQGEAKRITALIYIDGEKVGNTEVLADGNIEGKLNFQFGSYAHMEAIKDDQVYDQEIHISGSATPNSFGSTATNRTSEVKLNITGVTPTEVKANFIRRINSTQGSRQKEIIFSPGEGDTYISTMNFASPGEYVLRTVWLDGVEYKLDAEITVKVEGFAISSLDWQYQDNYVKIMSADSYFAEVLSLTFSGNGGYQPNKVQGIFGNADNQQITVNFRRGTSGWSGTAQFATSGTYTMEYLLVDGEYYEIPASMKKTIDLSLGMKAKVQISQTVLEKFTGNPPVTVDVFATVMDNKGNRLTEMENVSIQYLAQGSGLTENGLFSRMTWNSEKNRYEGKFEVKYAGAYEFGYLTMGNSSIHSADAPVITAIPPEPPSYYGNLTEENIFAFGAEVWMRIALKNSIAIADGKTIAVLEKLDESGNVVATVEVPGQKTAHLEEGVDNVTDWVFKIPTTEELVANYGIEGVSQVGTWRMKELYIIGAYKDGVLTTEDDPMIIDVSDKGIQTNIDDTMNVLVTGQNYDFVTTFLQQQVVTDKLSVQVIGADGLGVPNLEEVTITYKWDINNVKIVGNTFNVGYVADEGVKKSMEQLGTRTITLMQNKGINDSEYVIDIEDPMILPFEGIYIFEKVTFKLGNTVYTAKSVYDVNKNQVPLNAQSSLPVYSVEWETPVVEIEKVGFTETVATPFPVNTTTGTNTTSLSHANVTGATYNNSINETGTQCHVYYAVKKHTTYKGWIGSYPYVQEYVSPTVTLTLSNVNLENFSTAVLDVQGNRTLKFEFTNSLECLMNVGEWSTTREWIISTTLTIAKREILGNAKGEYITVSGKIGSTDIVYTFKLNNSITINNPY